MGFKKRLIEKDDYYEYSSSYVKKYILIALGVLIFAIIVFLVTYIPYNLVAKKSFMRNNTPEVYGENIMNEKGIYYTGNFTNIPNSIPIKEDMKETLYLYLFHDNHAVLWKLYKYGLKRYFSYNAFNLLDGDSQNFSLKEESKIFLDYYDNFTRAQFRRTNSRLDLEIPNFYNTSINFETMITNILDCKLNFRFTNFNAAMINWGKNRGLYMANYYFGYPKGYLIVPGSENMINFTSSILAINTVGRIPSRYNHNLIAGLAYIPYSVKPVPIFIYDSKPQSQNSKIIKFLYNNKWFVYDDFISHEYNDSIDFYSKESGFSFVYTVKSEEVKDSFGYVRKINNAVSKGFITGYFTVNGEQFNISGNAIKEFVHSVF